MLPISLANVILVACQALHEYLTISATSSSRRISGAGSWPYSAASDSPDRDSTSPMTVIGGSEKSRIAVPSRRNSGLTATPKSSPATLPEADSSSGMTTLCVVPGITVLRTTTVW